MRKTLSIIVYVFIIFLPLKLVSQIEAGKSNKIKVYLDCNAWSCDINFLKTELNWVDYVNDRFVSNVYILITSLTTGGGGQQYQVIFSGQSEFSGINDTLSYNRSAVETNDEDRRKLLKVIQIGLSRYLARTPQWNKLDISFQKSEKDSLTQTSSKKDKWNFWVFRIGANGSLSSSSNDNRKRISGNISANRTTEKNKTNFYASTRYSESKYFDYDTAGNKQLLQKFIQRNNDVSASYIHAMAKKISLGIFGGYRDGTFNNINSSFYLKPAVEYSFFPYKDFNTKLLTVTYKIGPSRNNYIDTTRYNKIKEYLWDQNLSINWSLTQKWGNLFFGATWTKYLNYFDKNNLDLFGFTEIRVVKGLNVNFYINYSFIDIQPYISKKEVDILEQIYGQRAIASTFDFSFNIGISYRFGSVLNNIVNPRLSGGGGNFYFFD